MTYHEKAADLYNLLNSGQLMDAFEKYYAENVVMIEATGEERVGKEINRQAELDFLNKVQEFHGSGVTHIASNEEAKCTMVEAWMEVTFKGAPGPIKMEQVTVQQWEGDQIIKERFYYNAAGM